MELKIGKRVAYLLPHSFDESICSFEIGIATLSGIRKDSLTGEMVCDVELGGGLEKTIAQRAIFETPEESLAPLSRRLKEEWNHGEET